MFGENEIIIVADDNFLVEHLIKYGELYGESSYALRPDEEAYPMLGDLEFRYA